MKRLIFFESTALPALQTDSWRTFGDYVFNWASKESVSASFMSYPEIVFELAEDGTTRAWSPFSGIDIASADFAVFRTIRDHNEQAEEVALFLQRHAIPYIDERVKPNAHGKYSWQVKYAENHLPFIPTVYGTGRALKEAYRTNKLQTAFPLVIKARQGRKGKDNYLVKNEAELMQLLEDRVDEAWVMQRFIENDGDYRVVVLGDKAETVIFRQRPKDADTHLNNTSQGASAMLVDISALPQGLCEDAVAAARVNGLAVAGVDMMVDQKTGRHVILEVNGAPQLATGAFPEEKMRRYTEYLSRQLDKVSSKRL